MPIIKTIYWGVVTSFNVNVLTSLQLQRAIRATGDQHKDHFDSSLPSTILTTCKNNNNNNKAETSTANQNRVVDSNFCISY